MIDKRLLYRMKFISLSQSFNRRHFMAVGLEGKNRTGSDSLSIENYGTDAAGVPI
jgi:hypothetical protein